MFLFKKSFNYVFIIKRNKVSVTKWYILKEILTNKCYFHFWGLLSYVLSITQFFSAWKIFNTKTKINNNPKFLQYNFKLILNDIPPNGNHSNIWVTILLFHVLIPVIFKPKIEESRKILIWNSHSRKVLNNITCSTDLD